MQILISGEAGFSVGMTGAVLIHHFGMVMKASFSDPKRRPTPSRILPISKRSGTELCEAIGLQAVDQFQKQMDQAVRAISIWAYTDREVSWVRMIERSYACMLRARSR